MAKRKSDNAPVQFAVPFDLRTQAGRVFAGLTRQVENTAQHLRNEPPESVAAALRTLATQAAALADTLGP
ncbi:MAG TPA: hypothetical protein VFW87_14305 [Pirellulales bacterium]|nr:hypothetical protein [Pirellulales bacterium]